VGGCNYFQVCPGYVWSRARMYHVAAYQRHIDAQPADAHIGIMEPSISASVSGLMPRAAPYAMRAA
jgi:hypothetical protein